MSKSPTKRKRPEEKCETELDVSEFLSRQEDTREGDFKSENENEEIVNSGRKRGPLINVKKGF